jgi:hypothetical protein
VAGGVAISSAVPGLASAKVEEPSYEVTDRFEDFEVRAYVPTIQARTTVRGGYRDGLYAGFRVLARYIFGGNAAGEKVAMTAPVGHVPVGEDTWEVTFTMPSAHSMETLPTPIDARIRLVEIPGGTYAAVQFPGRATERQMRSRRDALLERLATEGLKPAGEAVFAQYNPPWVPGFLRRNEVLVPLVGVDDGR